MGIQKNEMVTFKYTYDFSRDGGAVAEIPLTADVNALAAGFVVTGASIYVEETITSGGTPTITLGNTGTPAGYMADVQATMALVAGSSIREGEVAGSLLWDDTNDHALEYVIDTADNAVPSITVGANALTAGKAIVYIRGYMPGSVPA